MDVAEAIGTILTKAMQSFQMVLKLEGLLSV